MTNYAHDDDDLGTHNLAIIMFIINCSIPSFLVSKLDFVIRVNYHNILC